MTKFNSIFFGLIIRNSRNQRMVVKVWVCILTTITNWFCLLEKQTKQSQQRRLMEYTLSIHPKIKLNQSHIFGHTTWKKKIYRFACPIYIIYMIFVRLGVAGKKKKKRWKITFNTGINSQNKRHRTTTNIKEMYNILYISFI